MNRPVPENWQRIMRRAGIHSINQLRLEAELGEPTVYRIVHGTGKRPRHSSILKIAAVLNVTPDEIYEMIGKPAPVTDTPYEPPAESIHLTREERDALTALIKAMVKKTHGQANQDDQSDDGPQWGNVHPLRPTPHPEDPGMDLAADAGHGPSEGQLRWDHLDGLGEESQDHPGVD